MSEKIVCLDAGHGGSDPGACYGKLIEKLIVLVVTLSCREVLIDHGVKVVLTRATDNYVGLSRRAQIANLAKALYLVSIHCNAGKGDRGEVISSIYRGKGLQLSNNITKEMKALGQSVVKEYDKRGAGGTDYYAVIRETHMDAVIVECAFLDNEEDSKIIDTIAEQEAYGIAIAKGILAQLGIPYKGVTQPQNKPQPAPSKKPQTSKVWDDSVHGKIGVITGTGVNVRLDGNMNGKILGTVHKGQKFNLHRLEGDWYHCRSIYAGYNRCYVHKDYIKVQSSVVQEGTAYCTVKVLNVRNGATTDYGIQGVLNLNEKVTIIGKAGNWRQIRYYNAPAGKNKIGWVSAAYLRITKDV